MPALDYCHENIVHALEKDGWTVSDRQLRIRTAERIIYVDVSASKAVNGSRQQILLAEVKCFPNADSTTRDLYTAIGQYLIYRVILAEVEENAPLYLAIPEAVYEVVFDSTIRRAIQENRIKLLIVNLEREMIVQWIE